MTIDESSTRFVIFMNEEQRGCWKVLGSCLFAIWGAFLNLVTMMWMWSWSQNLDRQHTRFDGFFIPMALGFLLGIITPYVFLSRNTKFALQSGLFFAFIVASLIVLEVQAGTHFLVCLGSYGFSFIWALSLIAIGYILRSRPKHRMNEYRVLDNELKP